MKVADDCYRNVWERLWILARVKPNGIKFITLFLQCKHNCRHALVNIIHQELWHGFHYSQQNFLRGGLHIHLWICLRDMAIAGTLSNLTPVYTMVLPLLGIPSCLHKRMQFLVCGTWCSAVILQHKYCIFGASILCWLYSSLTRVMYCVLLN